MGAFLSPAARRRCPAHPGLLRVAALTAGVSAGYGLLQTLGFDPFRWTVIDWGAFRSFGTLGNPDMFGAYLVLALPLTVGLALSERDPRWKTAARVAFVLVGTAIFTSLTRAAWIGGVAG